MNTRDTTSTRTTAQIFYLIWCETLKAATSSKSGPKGETSNEWFSKIQSHITTIVHCTISHEVHI